MKFIKFFAFALFLASCTLAFAQTEKSIPTIFEDDMEAQLASDEEELIGMRLLAFEQEMNEAARAELLQESRQASNLMAQVEAEISILEDENQMLSEQSFRLEKKQEKILAQSRRLRQTLAMLLSENADLLEEEEEDEVLINQNMSKIKEVERQIQSLQEESRDVQLQIDETEEAIEANDDKVFGREELKESCEMVIQSNKIMLNEIPN
jgi:chromosome segregation ATPase